MQPEIKQQTSCCARRVVCGPRVGPCVEEFNVIGYALGGKPASIKNYRDEFDPLVSKRRKGWHKRPTREYCRKVFEDYKGLDVETFTVLIKAFAGYDENKVSETEIRQG